MTTWCKKLCVATVCNTGATPFISRFAPFSPMTEGDDDQQVDYYDRFSDPNAWVRQRATGAR